MKRFFWLFVQDISFQFKHGFYFAYLFVSILYIILLLNLPRDLREPAVCLLVFTDTGVLGFMFIGAIVLLEKNQNIYQSLAVTPVKISEFITAKLASLTIVAFFASNLITIPVIRRVHPGLIIAAAGVTGANILSTLIGLLITSGVKDLNGYFARSLLLIPVFLIPIMEFFGLAESPLFVLLPANAMLRLISDGITNTTDAMTIAAGFSLLVWICLLYIPVHKATATYSFKTEGRS